MQVRPLLGSTYPPFDAQEMHMAEYQAPLRDMRFVLNDVFEVAKLWAELPALAETVDAETVERHS